MLNEIVTIVEALIDPIKLLRNFTDTTFRLIAPIKTGLHVFFAWANSNSITANFTLNYITFTISYLDYNIKKVMFCENMMMNLKAIKVNPLYGLSILHIEPDVLQSYWT